MRQRWKLVRSYSHLPGAASLRPPTQVTLATHHQDTLRHLQYTLRTPQSLAVPRKHNKETENSSEKAWEEKIPVRLKKVT